MRRTRRGLTILELLVVITVLAIILPGLALIVSNYMGVYQRNYGRLRAVTTLASAQEQITMHLANLSMLVVPDDGNIVFRIPACGTDGFPRMPFDRRGVLLALYRSNTTGSTAATGNHLWLGRGNVAATSVTPLRRIAPDVTGLTFEYLDRNGNVISRTARFAASFDDRTVAWIRVTLTITDPGRHGAGGAAQPFSQTVTFSVAPRNNRD